MDQFVDFIHPDFKFITIIKAIIIITTIIIITVSILNRKVFLVPMNTCDFHVFYTVHWNYYEEKEMFSWHYV